MQSILQKFANPSAMFLDPCTGTGATAKAGLLENRHRKYVRWNMNNDCKDFMKASLIRVLANW